MTWKTRKERHDEKGVTENGVSEVTPDSATQNGSDPFIFDLSGTAFMPVSARRAAEAATPEAAKTEPPADILEETKPIAGFRDVSDDVVPTPETPAPVTMESSAPRLSLSGESDSGESDDDFVLQPIPATVLTADDAPVLSATPPVAHDDNLEPLSMPILAEAAMPKVEETPADDEPTPVTFDEPTFTPTPDAEPMSDAASMQDAVVEPVHDVAAEPSFVDTTPMPEPTFSMPEPTFSTPEPTFDVAPEIADTPKPIAIDREAVAPGLVYADAGGGIPRVAPFIVDIPAPAPIVQPAAPTLVVKFGKFSADFPLSRDVTTLGRPDSTTQTYPDIEIELDDTVSRRHAEVVKRGMDFFVVDVGSANGTKLNGEVLEPYQEMKIERGDRIHLGERTEIAVQ